MLYHSCSCCGNRHSMRIAMEEWLRREEYALTLSILAYLQSVFLEYFWQIAAHLGNAVQIFGNSCVCWFHNDNCNCPIYHTEISLCLRNEYTFAYLQQNQQAHRSDERWKVKGERWKVKGSRWPNTPEFENLALSTLRSHFNGRMIDARSICCIPSPMTQL